MSVETLHSVLDRAMHDEGFIARFRSDPESALDEYDLDDEERTALLSGKESRIRDILGPAMSQVFVVVIIID